MTCYLLFAGLWAENWTSAGVVTFFAQSSLYPALLAGLFFFFFNQSILFFLKHEYSTERQRFSERKNPRKGRHDTTEKTVKTFEKKKSTNRKRDSNYAWT